MTTQQTDIQTQAIELAGKAFESFCEDMSAMFSLQAGCQCSPGAVESFANISKLVPKLSAVHVVKSDGAINGTFYIVFDANALFAISGSVMMLPKSVISSHMKIGTQKEAEGLRDATQEVGNLLIGAWDRIFREHFEGHGHFVKGTTFIGELQDMAKQDTGIIVDGQYTICNCEVNIGEYPAGHCIVLFPQSMWSGAGATEKKPAETAKPAEPPKAEAVKPAELPKPAEVAKPAETAKAVETAKPAEVTKPSEAPKPNEAPKTAEVTKQVETPKTEVETKPQQASVDNVPKQADTSFKNVPAQQPQPVEQPAASAPEPKQAESVPVEKPVVSVAKTQVNVPAAQEHIFRNVTISGELSTLTAGDIMNRCMIWASPEDSVEAVQSLMQQHNTGYVIVGCEGVCKGIISRSNITEAISPFLRPIFAKWRRPLDDASLQIKVKWIMSTPVHTVTLFAALSEVVSKMSSFGGRCLPVVNADGQVVGIITVFDIFKVLMNSNKNTPVIGEPVQSPPLV